MSLCEKHEIMQKVIHDFVSSGYLKPIDIVEIDEYVDFVDEELCIKYLDKTLKENPEAILDIPDDEYLEDYDAVLEHAYDLNPYSSLYMGLNTDSCKNTIIEIREKFAEFMKKQTKNWTLKHKFCEKDD